MANLTSDQAYILSKKYTKDTAQEFGAVKGAPCTIKSIVHQNGQNIVTFEWTNSSGQTRESVMYVQDGTNVVEYVVGTTYHEGDIVLYENVFYRCRVPEYIAEPIMDKTKFTTIDSPDGNYDIVQNSTLLPSIFTSVDRKMYYSIEDEQFYLWNGSEWVIQHKIVQYITMPLPSATYENRIVQFIGVTDNEFTNGYFYKCIEDNSVYSWVSVDTFEIKELSNAQINKLCELI